jgi:heme/copper-type cytochrome/quinol oxidase subunit 2
MKIRKSSFLYIFLLAHAILLLQSSVVLAQGEDVQIIEMTAKKYEYSRSPIHVKSGTKVRLRITATDHDHGFKIAAVPDGAEANATGGLVFTSPLGCWELQKGETTTIEFVAHTPGTYTFRCCHTCGFGHRGMKGQLIVE